MLIVKSVSEELKHGPLPMTYSELPEQIQPRISAKASLRENVCDPLVVVVGSVTEFKTSWRRGQEENL